VAACDTFRAGAVEQLRTHARHLNALHPPKNGQSMVQLYEKGYGKDAAGVAAEAICFAKEARIDVVLVDTAGRMQDNEPLMRALAKVDSSLTLKNVAFIFMQTNKLYFHVVDSSERSGSGAFCGGSVSWK